MKIYIAGHNQDIALEIANAIADSTEYTVTSSWLYKPFHPTNHHTVDERIAIATEDYLDIDRSDALLIISSHKRVPGGKFVEVGIAIGQGKPVYLIGNRENMLMWHPNVTQYDSIDDFIKVHFNGET